MRSASLYRTSGNSLILAAVFWAVALLLLPRGVAQTVAEALARVGPAWIASAVIGIVGCVLGIVAMVGLYRHFAGGEHEGWALLAGATGVTGSIVNLGGMTIAAVAVPGLVSSAGSQAPPEAAAAAVLWTLTALAVVGGMLMWVCLIPFGLAMLRDPVWPKAIAWGAIVTGVVEAVGAFALMGSAMFSMLLSILGFAFLAFLGSAVARVPHLVAPAPEPIQPQVGV